METYLCELIDCNTIQERFYREGESVQDVLESLELFQWPDGEWQITSERELTE